jgi:hypothetical protein
MPNFNSSLFQNSAISTVNSYSPLNSTEQDSPGHPMAASSPQATKSKCVKHQHRNLKVLNVNCQSICPKKGEFQNLIDSTKPDIVIATETWLEEGKHHDGEIGEVGRFSSEYKIYRKDREDGYGGGCL